MDIYVGFLGIFLRLSRRLSLAVSKTIVLIIGVYIVSF
jgi:hypothetical protein